MSSRELIILILGLAIVVVVLRGLYVALRARKGQIRLSIDKNIPNDIDLEALELAELPSGGARVVARSLESVNSQNSQLDAALQRADELQLGSAGEQDGDVPILMDAVSLSNSPQHAPSSQADDTRAAMKSDFSLDSEDDIDDGLVEPGQSSGVAGTVVEDLSHEENDFADAEPEPQLGSLDESGDDEEGDDEDEIWENQASKEAESADDVLLDYEDDAEIGDSLASLAPEYRSDSDLESADEDYEDDSETDEDFLDEEEGSDAMGPDDDQPDRASIDAQAKSFEDQLDDFSLSAGERIGFNATEKPKPPAPAQATPTSVSQPSLFDEDALQEEFPEDNPKPEKTKQVSFFAALKRRMTPQAEPQDKRKPTEQVAAAPKDSAQVEAVTQAQTLPPMQPDLSAEFPNLDKKSTPVAQSKAQVEYDAEASSQPSEVLVINVMSKEGYAFAGDDLLQVLITAGLKFGEMNIFHQRIGADKKGPVLFSVANVLNPGTFDLNNMDDFTTLGVSFFLALPTVMNSLEAFEKMLAVAQQVKSGLDGEIKDDNRNVMNSQTIEHYRQRVKDFELRRLKAAGTRH
jgi:cell division protein ZipA